MTGANDEEGQTRASNRSAVSQRSKSQQYHVEIATLTLPAQATHFRVESGDGSTFVIEAATHVIDHLVDNDHQSESQDTKYGSTSEVTHSKLTTPHIEGVVDLDMVSHLVSGVTEEELVEFLQHDVTHTRNEGEVEEKPSKEDEESQLLKQSKNDEQSCLAVPSDPFANVTAEFHQDSTVEYGGLSSVNELKPSLHHLTATDENGGISVTREAYLLSIPTNERGDHGASYHSKDDETSAADSIFVLAVPENTYDEDALGSLKTSLVTSSTIAHTRAEEFQSMIEHAFAPLPTDIQHVELRVSTAIPTDASLLLRPSEQLHLDVVVDRKVPLIGYIILVSGLFALSSIGVAFDLQKGGVTPEMKAFWRFTATAIMFLILSAKSLTRKELRKYTWMEFWVWVPFAGINYGFMCTAFVVALDMTSLVNAFILSNLASLIIIGSKFVLGSPVLFLEGIGAAIGMLGALICAYAGSDSTGTEDHHSGNIALIGNILAFLASVSTALYLTVAKTMRPKVDLFVFMLFIFTYAAVAVLAYMIWAGQPFEVSTDPTIGLFGWVDLQMDRLPLELWMAIICNLLGTTGYIAIMKYFDPVVVSMVMLMEPIVASLMGAVAGVSTLPGLVTWAGDGVVVVGSILVILSGSKKTETIDATKAFHTVNEELLVEGKPKLLRQSSMSTKTPTLKRSIVLRSPTKQTIRKDRANTEDESMEFIFVGNKSRGDTTISSLRDSRNKVAWN